MATARAWKRSKAPLEAISTMPSCRIYSQTPESERRCSPAECIGAVKTRVEGSPDPDHIGTSYAQRQNLSMRMQTFYSPTRAPNARPFGDCRRAGPFSHYETFRGLDRERRRPKLPGNASGHRRGHAN